MYVLLIYTYIYRPTYIFASLHEVLLTKVTWFAIIPTNVSGTNIRTNCTMQKRRNKYQLFLKGKEKGRKTERQTERETERQKDRNKDRKRTTEIFLPNLFLLHLLDALDASNYPMCFTLIVGTILPALCFCI